MGTAIRYRTIDLDLFMLSQASTEKNSRGDERPVQ